MQKVYGLALGFLLIPFSIGTSSIAYAQTQSVVCNFYRNLFIGVRGEDVRCLQRYLNNAGFAVALSGAGSPGLETTYFGALTRAAVARWQRAHNVFPSVGFFGPISRATYNQLVVIPPQQQVAVVSMTSIPTGSTVSISNNVLLSSTNVAVANGPADLRSITYSFAGSANAADIRNFRLTVNGQTVGTTALLDVNNRVTFTVNPARRLPVGSASLDVYADIVGSLNRTVQLIILHPTYVELVDATYNVAITPSINMTNATVITIRQTQGQLSISSISGAPTYTAGTTNARIASFIITASSAEGARITSLSFDKDSDTNNLDLQNMRVMVGTSQFGSTQGTVGDGGINATFSNPSPIIIPAGGSVVVDVFADVLSSSQNATYSNVIDLTGWTATGSSTNQSINFPGAVSGHDVVIGGAATLTVSASSDMPPPQQLAMGSSNNVLFRARLTGSTSEDIRVTDITFTDTITGGATGVASFQNMTLWNGSTQIGGPTTLTVSGSATGTVSFHLSNPLIVPRNSSTTIELRGSVASFSSGGATSGSQHIFSLQNGSITAFGVSSNNSVTLSGTPVTGNTQTIVRTELIVSGVTVGNGSGRTRVALDEIALLRFGVSPSSDATINSVTLRFAGQAISGSTPDFTVSLIDPNTNLLWGASTAATCSPSGNACNVTFSPNASINAGTTKDIKVRINSSSFANTSQSDSLSVIMSATSDVTWSDGTTSGLRLETTAVPVTITNISYE